MLRQGGVAGVRHGRQRSILQVDTNRPAGPRADEPVALATINVGDAEVWSGQGVQHLRDAETPDDGKRVGVHDPDFLELPERQQQPEFAEAEVVAVLLEIDLAHFLQVRIADAPQHAGAREREERASVGSPASTSDEGRLDGVWNALAFARSIQPEGKDGPGKSVLFL